MEKFKLLFPQRPTLTDDIILGSIPCGYGINSSKFKTFCWENASLSLDLYPWYSVIRTLHKILIHGYEVIELFTLPLGMFFEEAQEATNLKFLRSFVKVLQENAIEKKQFRPFLSSFMCI